MTLKLDFTVPLRPGTDAVGKKNAKYPSPCILIGYSLFNPFGS